MEKGPQAFRTISEASDEVGVPSHVLRFWETRFSFIRPMKRAGGRRFYRPQDLTVLRGVRTLLHDEGFTIKDVQALHRSEGMARVIAAADRVATGGATSQLAGSESAPQADLFAAPPELRPVLDPAAQARLRGALGDLEAVKARIDARLAG